MVRRPAGGSSASGYGSKAELQFFSGFGESFKDATGQDVGKGPSSSKGWVVFSREGRVKGTGVKGGKGVSSAWNPCSALLQKSAGPGWHVQATKEHLDWCKLCKACYRQGWTGARTQDKMQRPLQHQARHLMPITLVLRNVP